MDNDNQQLLNKEGSTFCRWYVGVRYGRPPTLLDAANYVKEELDKVTDEIIKNAFINADLRINLDSAVTDTFDKNKLLKCFKNFPIKVTE